MLTLKEINEVSFGKAGFSGYKPGDVDEFIDEVIISFQKLTEEKEADQKKIQELEEKNIDMQKKLAILAEKVEAYRGDEDGIKDAVLSAHKMAKTAVKEAELQAKEIVSDAKNRADQMLKEAKTESKKILSGARDESARKAKLYAEQAEIKKTELEQLKKQVTSFRASLMELYKKHLEMINHIPNFKVKEEEETVPKTTEPLRTAELSESVHGDIMKKSEPPQAQEDNLRDDDVFRVEIPENIKSNTGGAVSGRHYPAQEYAEASSSAPSI